MSNWWEKDPVAPTPAAANWWEADPVHPGDATVNDAMRHVSPGDGVPAPQQAPKATPEPIEEPSVLGDVAKSAGIGIAQGGLGIATLPGNMEALARKGIDSGASALGFEDPKLSNNNYLPTYNDAKAGVEKYTGDFYQPKTTAGKYARTIGEFAPLAAFGGGGAVARAVNVLAPAVASETAGQLTEGTPYEPWARAGAALAGGVLPNAAMRAVTPITNDAARAAQVATLQHEGVDALTAGQQTGNKAVRWAESAAADVPFNGGRGAAMNNQAAEQFTAAVLRRAGVDSNRATPEVIDGAFTHLGHQFDDLAARNNIAVDRGFFNDLHTAWNDYSSVTPTSMRAPVVENVIRDIYEAAQTTGGQITGEAYQTLRSRLDKMSRDNRMANPPLSRALGNIRGAMDDAMGRSITPDDAAQWTQIRGQYRNMMAIENAVAGAGENTALGLISPSQLRTAVKQQNKRGYIRGQGDLADISRAGEAIMKPLPQSGTAPRIAAQNIMNSLGAVAGGAVGNVPGAIVGGLAPSITQGLMSRTLMSAPMQAYLANQRLTPAIEAYNASRPGALYLAPQAASDLVRDGIVGTQTHGSQ